MEDTDAPGIYDGSGELEVRQANRLPRNSK